MSRLSALGHHAVTEWPPAVLPPWATGHPPASPDFSDSLMSYASNASLLYVPARCVLCRGRPGPVFLRMCWLWRQFITILRIIKFLFFDWIDKKFLSNGEGKPSGPNRRVRGKRAMAMARQI